ncbi:unnamed protein product [Macrosiphum euphorbiae]|uniref:Uncharacterized protein n=1 Tax=Macrosiphum euphorbiae TaxID=13131 RepID=A0AAV0WNZ3_9HEMI|nr:unnamed protein product [Macrosiphum euphorbiae]
MDNRRIIIIRQSIFSVIWDHFPFVYPAVTLLTYIEVQIHLNEVFWKLLSDIYNTRTFPLISRSRAHDTQLTAVIQNGLIMLSLLITGAVLHAILFCFSVFDIRPTDILDTDSESDSDEIYHSDSYHSEDEEEYDADDESDNFLAFIFETVFNVLSRDDDNNNSDEEDSNSDEEGGHINEDVYRHSHDVLGVGVIDQRWAS